MSRTRLRPRPEQIEELTRGLRLPLPPLQETVLIVVAETLTQAWNDLAVRHTQVLRTGIEAEVTALLEARLIALLDENPCWATLASGVSRGRETMSFDGRHLEKRPDLSIHLTCRNFSFPLVAECKLIDCPDGKTVGLYCDDGLARFLRGDYAWSTREAFMLAYVRDKTGIASCLAPHLKAGHRESPDPYGTEQPPASPQPSSMDLACSRHSRHFRYVAPCGTTDAPGPINLWHLWLSVPSEHPKA